MKFGGIPKKTLDMVLGEYYESGEYTLRDEIRTVEEDIISYHLDTTDGFMNFTAWTKHFVMILVENPFGERNIIAVPRNPKKRGCK